MKPVEEKLHSLKGQNRSPLQIIPVKGRRAKRRFIQFPWAIYTHDPAWVPPLLLERHQHLSPRSPYFAHAQYRSWMAYRNGKPVGRISAQIDDLHIRHHHEATGFFGMLEAEDDSQTFHALMTTAENWLANKGMQRILGPFNLSINQECGVLVDGFDTPPSIMMGHARPYYSKRIEEQGYHKKKDLLAYRVHKDQAVSPLKPDFEKRVTRGVRIRPLDKSRFSEDVEILRDVFEDAWSHNWGFIPFTPDEFKHLGKDIRFLVNEDLVQIAEVDGTDAAMIVVLPNINEVIRDLNGRLLPFGWLKLLWRLKVTYPKTARIPLMGVRRRYHNSLLGATLAFMLIDAVRDPLLKRGVEEVEMSWILEDNMGMRNIIESIGGIAYKRYRIYEKALTQ